MDDSAATSTPTPAVSSAEYAGFSYGTLVITAAKQLSYSLILALIWLCIPLSAHPTASWRCGVDSEPQAALGDAGSQCRQFLLYFCIVDAIHVAFLTWVIGSVYQRLCHPRSHFGVWMKLVVSMVHAGVYTLCIALVLSFGFDADSQFYRYVPTVFTSAFLVLYVGVLSGASKLFRPAIPLKTSRFLNFAFLIILTYTYTACLGVSLLTQNLDTVSNLAFSVLFPIPCIICRFLATFNLSKSKTAKSAGVLSLSFWFFPTYQNVFLKAITLKIESILILLLFQFIVLFSEIVSNSLMMSSWFFKRFVLSRSLNSIPKTPLITAQDENQLQFSNMLFAYRQQNGMSFYHSANAQRLSVFLFLSCMVFLRYSWNAVFFMFSISQLPEERFDDVILYLGILAITEWASSFVVWAYILWAYKINALLLGGFELLSSHSLTMCVICGTSAVQALFLAANLMNFA
eukprot:ANDGO_08268.mRNA.1 hypothetical protein